MVKPSWGIISKEIDSEIQLHGSSEILGTLNGVQIAQESGQENEEKEERKDSCTVAQPKSPPSPIPIVNIRLDDGRTVLIQVEGSSAFSRKEIIDFALESTDKTQEIKQYIEEKVRFVKSEESDQPLDLPKNIIFKDLYDVFLKSLTSLYVENGYYTSEVRPPRNLEFPKTPIIVIERGLKEIEVRNRGRLNKSYICDRILLGAKYPFNSLELEEKLRLLRVNPRFDNIEASLIVDDKLKETRLIVRVEESDSFAAYLSVDNYSPPSIGSERVGTVLRYGNLTGLGDEILASYYRSTTGGSDILDFNYRVPLNAMEGTLQFRFAPYWQEITQSDFDELDIRAKNELYEVSFRQPLIRSIRSELALYVGFTYQEGETFLFDERFPFGIGPDEEGFSRTSTLKLGQNFIIRDFDGSWSFNSQFSFGIDMFDATTNPEPIPDGRFFSWLGQVQRAQKLSDNHLLIISGDIQLSPDSLLPAQQFVIGGGTSVRGYRQNARSGDNGFRLSIEDRITLTQDARGAPQIQIAPFVDMGAIWNKPNNPNELLDQRFLIGAGVGFLWVNFLGIDNLIVRGDYGYPFIDLDDRGDNIQNDGFHFGINYQVTF
ncbi:ShlB/FhaC/HecB family hemolysin secretion/activation protein [Okeania sp. SIO2B3]|uniref:ShlB/FhaC/HecB family hemolysin secretion/activation protein n=1 Tax=Okeania sp. SIO2B3 TaxID=2607784 RepID=UPI0013C09F99|nr:ShlB/FhaC/HecB family hemolysin secretion/activation protein [Okeania sp. SIO2B3]NET45935.1 ShlB/FhaC/HecB family hemolysin secretion/activation protein [Okeania sp. SIO2B3]